VLLLLDLETLINENWYTQAGTPTLQVSCGFKSNKKLSSYYLTFTQETSDLLPYHMPVIIALFDHNGDLVVPETTIELTRITESFIFDVKSTRNIIPSILRDFSAPVRLEMEQSDIDLFTLVCYDTNPFIRY